MSTPDAASGPFAEALRDDREAWTRKLAGPIRGTTIPADYDRRGAPGDARGLVRVAIGADTTTRLAAVSGGNETLVLVLLLTAIEALLHRLTGARDVVIATPIHERHAAVAAFNQILILRDEVTGSLSLRQLSSDVQRTLMEAYAHAKFPFQQLGQVLSLDTADGVEDLCRIVVLLEGINDRARARAVRSDVTIVATRGQGTDGPDADGADAEGPSVEGPEVGGSAPRGELRLELEYDTERFTRETIERFGDYCRQAIVDVLTRPDSRVADLIERGSAATPPRWSASPDGPSWYPRDRTIVDLFLAQVERTPARRALLHDGVETTYARLRTMAGRIAGVLRDGGIGPGPRVALHMDHSAALVASVLGVLEAGAAYVPVDPATRDERLARLLAGAAPRLVLTDRGCAERLPEEWRARALLVDTLLEDDGREPEGPSHATAESLAYIIFTSGSTGAPKGVAISHRALVNYVWWAQQVYAGGEPLAYALHSSLAFDLTVTSIFTPLITGGHIVIYPTAERRWSLAEILADDRVDVIKATPSHLAAVRDVDHRQSRLTRLIVGGEAFETALAKAVHDGFGGRLAIFNEYGPTEATVGCMIHRYDPARDDRTFVPIGRPAANVRLSLRDESMRPVPDGAVGQLFIAGDGLAEGYADNDTLTAARFVRAPEPPHERMYASGDRARALPGDLLEYLGRQDEQVKYHGHRLELNELKAALNQFPGIRTSVVVLRKDDRGHAVLMACYVARRRIATSELRAFMARHVAEETIPNLFVHLDKLPLTVNGKVDLGALPTVAEAAARVEGDAVGPRTPVEETLGAIWREVLGLATVGIHQSFFELGGDSILSLQMVAKAVRHGLRITPADVFTHQTIATLAAVASPMPMAATPRAKTAAAHASRERPDTGEESDLTTTAAGPVPLTPIQHWFFEQALTDPHHFNQAICVSPRERIDADTLEQACQALTRRHDALRLCVVRDQPARAGESRQAEAREAQERDAQERDAKERPAGGTASAWRQSVASWRGARVSTAIDLSRLDSARLDSAQLDEAPRDGTPRDGARRDGGRLDGARVDRTPPNDAPRDGARLDSARLDSARHDGAARDGAARDEARLDGARLDGARVDTTPPNGAPSDEARLDGGRPDGPRLESARLDDARLTNAIAAASDRLQRSFDLGAGLLWRVALVDLGPDRPQRLVLIAHHLAVDGVSWRILLQDLQAAYHAARRERGDAHGGTMAATADVARESSLTRGSARQPTARERAIDRELLALMGSAGSFAAWARALPARADTRGVREEAERWLTDDDRAGAPVAPLPRDATNGDGTTNDIASASRVIATLTREETDALLRIAGPRLRARIDELLLAALADVVGAWSRSATVLIDTEGHGREIDASAPRAAAGDAPGAGDGIGVGNGRDWGEGSLAQAHADLSRTVGWFTTIRPLWLRPAQGSLGARLRAIKTQVRRVPAHGIGYGLLRYLSSDADTRARLSAGPQAEISANYLGQFDQLFNADDGALFEVCRQPLGATRSPRGQRRYVLEIDSRILGGELQMVWTYGQHLHRRDTIHALAERTVAWLRDAVATATARVPEALTQASVASDFPLAALDQRTLDRLVDESPDLEDIYPLSHMQEGMLFHARYEPEAGAYLIQFACRIDGAFEPAIFRRAWQRVIDRHPIFRTRIAWQRLPRPLQIVHARVDLPWIALDWTDVPAADQSSRWEALLQRDRAAGFAFDAPPSLRVTLVTLADDVHRVLCTSHHLALDGWSSQLLLREVLTTYEALSRVDEPRLAPPPAYREYIAWLQRQDLAAAERFWTDTLRGFTTPTPIPLDRFASGGASTRGETVPVRRGRLTLSAETTAALGAIARERRLTLNTLCQGAWAMLLARASGQRDVVFGVTVSGRPSDLDGMESMLGPFFNTLPFRVRVDEDATLGDWLASLQARQAALLPFQHCSLVQMQGWSAVPRGLPLFESVLVFENYPMDHAMKRQARTLGVRDFRVLSQGHGLSIIILPGDQLEIDVWKDDDGTTRAASRVEGSDDRVGVQPLIDAWRTLLDAIASRPDATVGALLHDAQPHDALPHGAPLHDALLYDVPVDATSLHDGDARPRRPGPTATTSATLAAIAAAQTAPAMARTARATAWTATATATAWTGAATADRLPIGIHRWFEAQAARTPDAIAVVGVAAGQSFTGQALTRQPLTGQPLTAQSLAGQSVMGQSLARQPLMGQPLTYRQLNARANQLARFLRARGVSAEQPVGICLSRTPLLMVALLGTLKAGGCYVPLERTLPPARLAAMLAETPPLLVLTDEASAARLPAATPRLCLDAEWSDGHPPPAVPGAEHLGAPTGDGPEQPRPEVARRIDRACVSAEDDDNLPAAVAVHPDQAAYVLYTSGSTGRPKGVVVTHRGLANYLDWCVRAYGLADRAEADASEGVASEGVGSGGGAPVHSPIGFDLTVTSLFAPLLAGAPIVLLPEEPSIEALQRALRQAQHDRTPFDVVKLTPAHLALLERSRPDAAADATSSSPCRVLVVGGEALPASLVRWWHRWAPDTIVVNEYGPTETVVGCCVHAVRRDTAAADAMDAVGHVPIGRPIANTELYILDDQMQPVAAGAVGELYVGGAGVARGYRGRPALTAERFVPHPFSETPGLRLYRTGDLARAREDGVLECLGRVDRQVKIRGHRIELDEIRAHLVRYPGIRDAVCVVRADDHGDDVLMACYVTDTAGRDVDHGRLRAHLAEHVPAEVVPNAFARLDALPLTSHGKVDLRALPSLDDVRRTRRPFSVGPRTPLEETMAAIWQETLGLPSIGVHDDFFALGGHSLIATRLIARVQTVFGREVPIRLLFDHPTIAAFTSQLETAAPDERPPLVRVADGTAPPLSFAQERLWFLDRLMPGSSAYTIAAAIRMTGTLAIEALRRSLDEVVRRHDILRTTFAMGTTQPMQVVSSSSRARVPLPVVDLTRLAAAAQQTMQDRLARAIATHPFELARGPLLRLVLVRVAADQHVLLVAMHHIVVDGWSMGILIREVGELYRAYVENRPSPLTDLPVQYADYARWQRQWLRQEVLDRHLAYWRARLTNLPRLALPTDRPRPVRQTHRGAVRRRALGSALTADLQALSLREGVTLYMTLLAAWQILLFRYTGQDDFAVGSPIAGRTTDETSDLIGMFVNTLVLRADFSARPTVRALLAETRESLLGAYAHQDLPFEKLVMELRPERDPARHPLFQVAFGFDNTPRAALELPGLVLESMEPAARLAKFDLMLTMAERRDGLHAELEYNVDLLEAETIDRWLAAFEMLLRACVATPNARVTALPLLPPAEREYVVEACNRTAVTRRQPVGVLHAIEAQAARTPDALAAIGDAEKTLTYRELDARATALADALRRRGVARETPVGLCLTRTPTLLVAMLAVWKAGGAYVPLEPTLPRQRLAFMIDETRPAVVLTESIWESLLPPDVPRLCLGTSWSSIVESASASAVPYSTSPIDASQLAYILYTSGSTGRPKGVMVTHGGLDNYLRWAVEAYGLTAESRAADGAATGDGAAAGALAHSPIGFDLTVTSLLAPLLAGAAVTLVEADGIDTLQHALREGQHVGGPRFGIVKLTPAHLALLRGVWGHLPPPASPCRVLIVGGEALPGDLVAWWHTFAPDAIIVNEYGPTETVVGCCVESIGPIGAAATSSSPPSASPSASPSAGAEASRALPAIVPIGRAISNTTLYVLDSDQQPVPVGVVGELYIGGAGVARGYLHRPAVTAAAFVPDPFATEPGRRLYRTGDLARRRADGTLDCLGRVDQQIKIRGHRVELDEIAAVVRRHPAVRDAAIALDGDSHDDPTLIAYIVCAADEASAADGAASRAAPSRTELQHFLRQELPAYMVPATFVTLDALPYTANGKLDRRALPKPERAPRLVSESTPASSDLERTIAAAWQDALGLDRVGVDENVFDLGGHSLLLVRVAQDLQRRLGREIPVLWLFEHPTIAALATHLGGAAAATPITSAGQERAHMRKQLAAERRPLARRGQSLVHREGGRP